MIVVRLDWIGQYALVGLMGWRGGQGRGACFGSGSIIESSVRPISKFLCRFDIDILPQQNADNRPISIFLRSRADICRYHIKKSLSTQKHRNKQSQLYFTNMKYTNNKNKRKRVQINQEGIYRRVFCYNKSRWSASYMQTKAFEFCQSNFALSLI